MSKQEEDRYRALNAKFHAELSALEKQIEALDERRNVLHTMLYGDPLAEEEIVEDVAEDEPTREFVLDKSQLDFLLVRYIREYGPVVRQDITEYFTSEGADPADLRRALERCKRRGLITVDGRSKSAVWSVV